MQPRIVKRLASLAFAGLLMLGSAAAADSVAGSTNQGYGRLLFTLTPSDQVSAQVSGNVLTISFNRKTGIAPDTIAQAIPGYMGSGRLDADGKTYRFVVNGPVRVHTSSAAGKFVVDLSPPSFRGTPPDLAQPVTPKPPPVELAKLPVIKVRSGAYSNFTRVVFDWPRAVPYKISASSGKLTVRFEAPGNLDFSAIDRQSPPWVKSAGWNLVGTATIANLQIDSASGYHDFRDGSHVVVDVLSPKTDADSYNPPGMAHPTVTMPSAQALKAQPRAPAQPDHAKDHASDAAKPNAGAHAGEEAPLPEGAGPNPQAANEDGTSPTSQIADGRVTKDGAVLVFQGAARQGVAVFTRGLNAWIILQSNTPLDIARLKTQLGSYPTDVEATSGGGIARVRIALRQPQAIAAFAEGSNLKVVIAPQVNPTAIALEFSRNQETANKSTISTTLAGANRVERLIDPLAGDEILVAPGLVGRYVPSERTYIEFATLPSAAGLVVMPYVDDLSVSVQGSRVTIARPSGLSLTPPTMSAYNASRAQSPCFLDFARWGIISGGSFLNTERRLRNAAAHLGSDHANEARLKLARFYLANKFAAEALGVIAIMQAADPGMSGDMQLQTMKAAALLQMGRPREALNALSGAQFDSDRHAALWRGLTAAALESWPEAQTNLDQAASVLGSYDAETQARARLASAESAMANGHLELAEAALERLPAKLTGTIQLQAQLDRARIAAAQRQIELADTLFDKVEGSGNEMLAAQAIYYRVGAGLTNGTLKPQEAINALERLRFRWRGGSLEINTLRKLADIYFSQQRWREGLNTLRVISTNFTREDISFQAIDDMRTTFVNLFLKGEADKMAPVAALGLFYDFIDLTPIGPDGDEMIRKMADRLVKVDLLGPAADLLNYQVTKRLDGVARAQVATRLAMVQLMDHKPGAVLETLRTTQISTVPDTVAHQRLLLEARALAEEKRFDQALDLIAVDQQDDTKQLRAEIYWKSSDWPLAAQAAEQSLGERYKEDTPLTDLEREIVMRAAVAYSLANDQTSLDRLRINFTPKMAGTPNAQGFAVVTERIDLQGVAFRDTAAKVASVDTLKLFMAEMQNGKKR